QAVIAIENVRLFKELQERTQELTRSVEELRALGEVGRAGSSMLDFQSVLASIVSHAVDLSQADAGTIYQVAEARQVFVPQANYGMNEELIETLRQTHIGIGVGETGIGQAAAMRRAVQIPDLEKRAGYALAFMVSAGFRLAPRRSPPPRGPRHRRAGGPAGGGRGLPAARGGAAADHCHPDRIRYPATSALL